MRSLKRPLAVTGFSMLITVLCFILSDSTALIVFSAFAASVGLILCLIFRFRLSDTFSAIFIGAVLSCLLLLTAQYCHDKAISLCGPYSQVTAVITESAQFSPDNGRYYAVARVKSINSERSGGKIRLSFAVADDDIDPDEIKAGDKISFTAYVYPIGTDSSEIHNSFKSKNVFLGAYSLKNISREAPKIRPLYYYAELLREKISSTLSFYFTDSVSGVLIAILTGDKSECPDEVYLNFKRSGAAHIMAVSGMHLSAWITALLFLAGKSVGRLKKLISFLGFFIIVFFLFIADFSPSVCRAAIMTSLFIVGKLINAETDMLNSLGFALVCVLTFNPYAVYSVSFQLSFACVFAIAAVAIPLCDKAQRFVEAHLKGDRFKRTAFYFLSYLIVSISIGAVTFPLSAYHFGYVSLVSPLTNLLLVPVCAPLMILCVAFLLLHNVPFISRFLFVTTDIFAKYMLKVTEKLSSSPLATLSTDAGEIALWFALLLLCGIMLILRRLDKRYFFKLTAAVLFFVIAFSSLYSLEKRFTQVKLKIISTENDSACLLVYNGKGVLVGTDSEYGFTEELSRAVEAENISLHTVLAEDDCNVNELEMLCADFGAEYVLHSGDAAELAGDVSLINNGCCAKLNIKGKTIAVFYQDYLQEAKDYDIIIRNDGTVVCEDGKTYYAHNKGHNTTVYINDSDSIKVRRENRG